jgi:hypothetical protein
MMILPSDATLLPSPAFELSAASLPTTITGGAATHISDDTRWQPTSSIGSSSGVHSWLLDNVKNTLPSSSTSFFISQSIATDGSRDDSGDNWTRQLLQIKKQSTIDKVKRVIDSNTIQLEKSGIVSLDVVRGAGSTYVLPECCTYAPSYKLKQLLKRDTQVRVINNSNQNASSSSSPSASTARPRVWIIRGQDELNVNRELIRTGFGFVRKGSSNSSSGALSSTFDYEGMMKEMTLLEQQARDEGLGIFKVCSSDGNSNSNNRDSISTTNIIAEFEPMEYETQIEYGDDGGKSVLVSNKQSSTPPSNPGDVRGCSDFQSYEDALSYYEKFYPYYGDVAKLDRDGDGVPCPGLPHTSNQDRYRMKRPR